MVFLVWSGETRGLTFDSLDEITERFKKVGSLRYEGDGGAFAARDDQCITLIKF
jgi:hypothetical protein